MNKEKINIITLGDIFDNLETDKKAFEFLKYIKELKEQNKKYKELLDKIKEYMRTLSDEYATNNYDIKCEVYNKIYYELLEEIE